MEYRYMLLPVWEKGWNQLQKQHYSDLLNAEWKYRSVMLPPVISMDVHRLPLLFCWGFHCWYEEEDCQNVVSLNNRNTDRQLPGLEGVRLKSKSIYLCSIHIKMAGSAPPSCCSLCTFHFKCLSSQSMSEGSRIATSLRCESGDEFTL